MICLHIYRLLLPQVCYRPIFLICFLFRFLFVYFHSVHVAMATQLDSLRRKADWHALYCMQLPGAISTVGINAGINVFVKNNIVTTVLQSSQRTFGFFRRCLWQRENVLILSSPPCKGSMLLPSKLLHTHEKREKGVSLLITSPPLFSFFFFLFLLREEERGTAGREGFDLTTREYTFSCHFVCVCSFLGFAMWLESFSVKGSRQMTWHCQLLWNSLVIITLLERERFTDLVDWKHRPPRFTYNYAALFSYECVCARVFNAYTLNKKHWIK